MVTPHYLIAKYLPDLMRGEPRNIGVVVWTTHGVVARFAAERAGHAGEVDGRSIPSFVTSPAAYKQWIEFWQAEVAKPAIVPATGGSPVVSTQPQFLDALAASSNGNFVLADGGFLLDPINEDDLPTVLNELYVTLVDSGTIDEARDPRLDDLCEEVIKASGASSNPGFRQKYSVNCRIAGDIKEDFEFSYGYGNGVPKRLYQRVPMPRKQRSLLRKTVHDTAWMFEKVVNSGIVKQCEAISLVYVPTEHMGDSDIKRNLDVLNSVSRVLNLADSTAAIDEFTKLPPLDHN